MDRDELGTLTLTLHESMTLQAGLDCYLREFQAHRAEDGGVSHPEPEWEELQRHVRQLHARLEQLGRSRG
jgi:hypothetical protein